MKAYKHDIKTYKSSDLTHKRAEVLQEAAKDGVIIQQLETNGKVRHEFVLFNKVEFDELTCETSALLDAIIDGKQDDRGAWSGPHGMVGGYLKAIKNKL